jgi:phenylalanyl-tRNA synthetase alpha chain
VFPFLRNTISFSTTNNDIISNEKNIQIPSDSINNKKGLEIDILIERTKELQQEAIVSIASACSSKEIELFRVLFLGKNGKLSGMMKEMRSLGKEDKPRLGEVVNKAVTEVETAIETAKLQVVEKEYQALLEREDLGSSVQISGLPMFEPPAGTRHPINLVMELALEVFEQIGYEAITGPERSPEIENDFFNFEALGMPPNHPARDMQDTFYLDTSGIPNNETSTLLLRTHTSAVGAATICYNSLINSFVHLFDLFLITLYSYFLAGDLFIYFLFG